MRCQVIKPFNRRGEIQQYGSFIEVPEDMFLQMAGYVQAATTADTYTGQGCKYWPKVCQNRYSCHGLPCSRLDHFMKSFLPHK